VQILKWLGVVVLCLGGLITIIALIGASLPVKHTATRAATFKASRYKVQAKQE